MSAPHAARPTLNHVAEAAGVSVASASRALSGASASPDMVARVREAAKALGYVADSTARSLKVRRTEQLALSVADLGNPVYVAMMRAVEDVVRTAGYRLVLSSTGSDTATEIDIIRDVNRGYADGLIVCPLRVTGELLAELEPARVPLVVIGTLPAEVAVDNVRVDSARGVALAVEHLLDIGRRRIAFIDGPIDTTPGSRRSRGYHRAMSRFGFRPKEHIEVFATDFTHAAGAAATRALVASHSPDALICANDLLAMGALRVLHQAGLDVPGDVAVVGMDDTELAEMVTPALSSVDLRSAQRGRIAATMLLDRLSGPRPPKRTSVSPRLVIRASSGGERQADTDGHRAAALAAGARQ